MNFLLGLLVGAGIGIAAAALLLKVGGSRELVILRGENRALLDAIRAARMASRANGLVFMTRYLDHFLADEAGA